MAAKDIGGLAGTGIGTAVGGPAGAAIGGGVGSILGGLFGSDEPSPYDIWKAQRDRLDAVDIPTLQALVAAGEIPSSALANLNVDPTGRNAEVDALNAMTEEYNRGGASVTSRAAQAGLLDRAAQQERSDREAVMQEMARRGQLGGGTELAARLQGQQNQYRGNAAAGAQIAGDDRARALAAMEAAGSMGSNIRGQDTALATTRAQAYDALNRWNAENRRSAYGDRVGWQLTKATGQNVPTSGMAQGAQEGYTRGVNTGGAIGTVAGGAVDAYRNGKQPKPGDWGYDASNGFDNVANYG